MNGVLEVFKEHEVEFDEQVDLVIAPGAFELPLIAQTLADTGRYHGVICLGCVIKGETAHFEAISMASSMGILQASLQTDVPIGFGVLTVYNREQAISRSKPGPDNKGIEVALAVVESIKAIQKIRGETEKEIEY